MVGSGKIGLPGLHDPTVLPPTTPPPGDLDPEKVVRSLFRHAHRLAGVDAAMVFTATGDRLTPLWSYEVDAHALGAMAELTQDPPSVVSRAEATGTTQIWPHPQLETGVDPWMETLGWRRALAVPIVGERGLVGVLLGCWSTGAAPVSEAIELLELLAAYAGSSLDRAQLFQELKREEQRLRSLLDGLPVPAVLVDIHRHVIIWLNSAAVAIFGEARGVGIEDLITARVGVLEQDQTPASANAIAAVSRPGPADRVRMKANDGSVLVLDPTVALVSPSESLVTFHDVTSEAQIEMVRARFLRMISHHLRTPLTPLVGYLSLIEERIGLDDPLVAEAISVMRSTVDSMTTQADRLAAAAAIRAAQPADNRQITAGELIDAAWENIGGQADQLVRAGDLGSGLVCAVEAVVAALAEVFDNALSHGVPPVTVTVSGGSARTEIEIRDEGPGVPSQWADAIFSPYVSAGDSYLAAPAGHTGLGLTLARLRIEAAGGSLGYETARRAFILRF